MTLDLNAIHADYEAWQKAHQSFDTDQWHLTANRLAGWVPDLLAALAVAERDRDEWRRRAERAQPVLDAARAWHDAMLESTAVGVQVHDMAAWNASEELCAAVDEFDRCPICGPGGCAGHTRNAADPLRCPTCESPAPNLHPAVQCEGEVQICNDPWHGAGHTRKPSEVERCVCSHTNHDYNGTTVKELNPDVDCPVHGEKACSHCGGMDGTHTIRDCAGHARAVTE